MKKVADDMLRGGRINQDEYNRLEQLGLFQVTKEDFVKEAGFFSAIGNAFKPSMMQLREVRTGLNVGLDLTKKVDDVIDAAELLKSKPIMVAPLAQRIAVPAAAALAAGAIGKEAVVDPIMQKYDESKTLKALKSSTPSLSGVDDKEIKNYFGVIQSFAPKAATNPLVAGALVNKMVQFEGVDSNLVKDLTQIQSGVEGNNIFRKMLEGGTSAMLSGM